MLLVTVFSQQVYAAGADDFVIQVQTDLHVNVPVTSDNKSFTIRTKPGITYNYNVDCKNDGVYEAMNQTGDFTCVYQGPNEYIIRIEDNIGDGTGFPQIYYNNAGDKRKITDIIQWGTGKWISMEGAFRGSDELGVSAVDVPNLTLVTDMSSMFRFASLANPDTSGWDVSHVTTFHSMFRSAIAANPDTSNWDTSSAQIMTHMFWNAMSVNPDVRSWDVTGVTEMTLMFGNVTLPTVTYDSILVTFESQLVQNNVVLDGGNSKFCSIAAQNAHANLIADHTWTLNDLGLCNANDSAHDIVFEVDTTIVGSTTNLQFEINTLGSGYNYNVDCDDANAGINTATGQTGNYVCNYTIPGIYIIRISDNAGDKTGFSRFYSVSNNDVKKIINFKQWGTGIWKSMRHAFNGASNMIVTAIDVPDLSNVTTMYKMFKDATSVNPDVSNWKIANVTNMSSMFDGATFANPDVSNWNTVNVTNLNSMFARATLANPDVSGWDTSNVTNMLGLFSGATSANPDVSGWDTSNVTDMLGLFAAATSANPDVSGWNTANTRDMSSMFLGAISANPDVSSWNTAKVFNMGSMFKGATSAIPDMSNWNITGLSAPFPMFRLLSGITLPTTLYDATLANFNAQITVTGIGFDGGNSKYCDVAVRDSLINVQGWTITDGGLDSNCPSDDIFINGFEDVIIFKAAQSQFSYDFSEVSITEMDEEPLLIAQGVDAQHKLVIQVYLRNDVGQLQIRLDKLDKLNANDIENIQWIQGQWQSIDNTELTVISW